MGNKFVTNLKLLSAAIIISILFSNQTVHAENIITYPVTGTYEQTSARKMLDSINNFRTGADAWYWNENDTQKVVFNNLPKLVYDYDLEKTAMQRAMEISVYYSHTRPNGKLCNTAYSGYCYFGENIAYGYDTADAVFKAWQETNNKYVGQGHRRNMLATEFTCVAIGHVIRDDIHYWVQEFRAPTVSTAVTPVTNATKTAYVDCLSSKVKHRASVSGISLQYGDTCDLSDIEEIIYYNDGVWYDKYANYSILTKPITAFTVSDSSVISVDKTTLKGLKAGNANLQGNYSNNSAFTIPVTVKPVNISNATCSPIPNQTATGSALTPAVTLKYKDNTLVSGTDYSTQYSNNVNAGYATVTITGKGNFTGTTTTSFYIESPPEVNNNEVDANNQESESNRASNTTSKKSASDDSLDSFDKIKSFSLKKGKKSLTVSWDKVDEADKYEIQYSTNKKFTDAKTKTCKGSKKSVKIKKLKSGKKYYVRIRYRQSNYGIKTYSKWSKVKKVKVS